MNEALNIRRQVQDYYAARISEGSDCCGGGQVRLADDLAVTSFGCGSPTDAAALKPGETVLDLGSGAGLDCFRAAERVGPQGKVIGVDMTPEMLARAEQATRSLGLSQVEFREGFIESLPVRDSSIDVVISNCVINLSPEKEMVFAEIARVLKPGGRMVVSDILKYGSMPAAVPETADEAWCACITGAVSQESYRELVSGAGLVGIRFDPTPSPPEGEKTYSATVYAERASP